METKTYLRTLEDQVNAVLEKHGAKDLADIPPSLMRKVVATGKVEPLDEFLANGFVSVGAFLDDPNSAERLVGWVDSKWIVESSEVLDSKRTTEEKFENLRENLISYLAEREEELTEKARELEMELWDEPADREEFGWKLDELVEEAEKVRKLREELEAL